MKKLTTIILYALILAILLTQKTYAANFSLDPTFGINGKQIQTFSSDTGAINIGLQSSGKIITSGYVFNGNNYDWLLIRSSLSGNLDSSFGVDGIFKKNFGGDDIVKAMAIQVDDKILVGGFSGSQVNNFLWTLARLNPEGSLDVGFGSDGTIISNSRGVLNSLAVQSDNKIIAVGYFLNSSNGHDDVALVRYNPNGSLDTTFGVNGVVLTQIGNSNDRGNSSVIQQDGKIIVVGDFDAGGHDDVFLVRYNANGSLDSSFGSGGKVTTQLGAASGGRMAKIQSDGKIVITGSTIGNGLDTYVARYNANGSLDSSFGSGGKVILSFSPVNDASNSLVLQTDGKIIIGGQQSAVNSVSNFALRRFNNDGSIDSSFGTNGSLIVPIGSGASGISSIVLQQDEKILAVGNTFNGAYNDWVLARFAYNGTNDLSVPLLKQTDPLWANNIYDSANLWSTGSTDISRWGCAITSAAMVLQFNKITKLPNGQDLTPGTLNSYLLATKDGYLPNGITNWHAISVMTKKAKTNNPDFAFDALKDDYRGANDTTTVENDLNNNMPDILQVDTGGGMHFVVAKGKNGATLNINDPFFDRSDLSSYGDSFASVKRFVPTNTDLSFLMFLVDPNANIVLKDDQGNIIGQSSTEIPIGDPLNILGNTAGPLKQVIFSEPPTGNYKIEVSSTDPTQYYLHSYLYDIDGNLKMFEQKDVLGQGDTDTYNINFDKNNILNINIEQNTTLTTLRNDVIALYSLGHIKKEYYKELLEKIKEIEKNQNKKGDGFYHKLKELSKEIGKKKGIDVYSTDILLNDIKLLINSLPPSSYNED